MEPGSVPVYLTTDRGLRILKILADAGIRESGVDAEGRPYENAPPQGLTGMASRECWTWHSRRTRPLSIFSTSFWQRVVRSLEQLHGRISR